MQHTHRHFNKKKRGKYSKQEKTRRFQYKKNHVNKIVKIINE